MLSRIPSSSFAGTSTTNGGFYFVNQLGRLLDPRAGRGAHVQSKRSCIHRGKEILAKEWNEQPGWQRKRREIQRRKPLYVPGLLPNKFA